MGIYKGKSIYYQLGRPDENRWRKLNGFTAIRLRWRQINAWKRYNRGFAYRGEVTLHVYRADHGVRAYVSNGCFEKRADFETVVAAFEWRGRRLRYRACTPERMAQVLKRAVGLKAKW